MIEPFSVVAVILAAGQSRRFGPADKLMADYRGRPLVVHAAEFAASLPFLSVLAVTRTGSEVAPLLGARGIEVHINPAPEVGMASSLAIGIQAASRHDTVACLVLLGDMPNVTPAHLLALFAAFDAQNDIVVSSAEGRRMPPTLFGRRHFPHLCGMTGDRGAYALTQGAHAIEGTGGILDDIDTLADLAEES